MPMKLEELVEQIRVERTVLLLGAGAAMPSGGPSGVGLAQLLASKIRPEPDSDDLAEIAGIFENRMGRRDLAETVRKFLIDLEPTGGLLALPAFNWRAIYSTNFDKMIETSYRRFGKDLSVIRSNFDYSHLSTAEAKLYKIHGCISQDIGYGDRSRMVLTESDYDEVREYRQTIFTALQTDMHTADTLIIGQSLRDAHLRNLAKEVAQLRTQGVMGRIYLLLYDYNEDRAQLMEQRGIYVIQGEIDGLMHGLSIIGSGSTGVATGVYSTSTPSAQDLKPSLASATIDVSHAQSLPANPTRLFNGSPATYGDIRHGLTIHRAVESRLQDSQQGAHGYFTVLSGAGGVGKTSLARAIVLKRLDEGLLCWEHQNAFPLNWRSWLEVEAQLRKESRQGVLLIDDCSNQMASVNRLVESLGSLPEPHLRIILTTNSGHWRTRTKSGYFFSRGTVERLSELAIADIDRMINLLDQKPQIRHLVEDSFLRLSRSDKVRRLRDRCRADMFVCLKNIFHNENLDNILLQEFASLDESAQDVYRHVSAVQAMGGQVHRQLVVRLLGIDVNTLQLLLSQMDDVIFEYDIRHEIGLYGWTARHEVIAQTIATYKFSDQYELYSLLGRIIDSLNPAQYLEIDTARSMASNDMGISRLSDKGQQVELLQKLIRVVPGERIPRRRLIRLHLSREELAEADQVIASFRTEIGNDNIVDRYRCYSAIQRAEVTPGLLEEDRKSMLLEAERIARSCISNQRADRYNYRALASVGRLLAQRFNETSVLIDAINLIRDAEAGILDPDFAQERRDLESTLRRIESNSPDKSTAEEWEDSGSLLADST